MSRDRDGTSFPQLLQSGAPTPKLRSVYLRAHTRMSLWQKKQKARCCGSVEIKKQ